MKWYDKPIKGVLLLLLIPTLCLAQWHPIPWDKEETLASVTEAVGVGAALPTTSYLVWNRLSPTHRPQKRMGRIMITHLGTMGLAMATMRGPSRHDQDPRYTNVILIAGASLSVNLIVDGFRNGWWMGKVAKGIKKNS